MKNFTSILFNWICNNNNTRNKFFEDAFILQLIFHVNRSNGYTSRITEDKLSTKQQ